MSGPTATHIAGPPGPTAAACGPATISAPPVSPAERPGLWSLPSPLHLPPGLLPPPAANHLSALALNSFSTRGCGTYLHVVQNTDQMQCSKVSELGMQMHFRCFGAPSLLVTAWCGTQPRVQMALSALLSHRSRRQGGCGAGPASAQLGLWLLRSKPLDGERCCWSCGRSVFLMLGRGIGWALGGPLRPLGEAAPVASLLQGSSASCDCSGVRTASTPQAKPSDPAPTSLTAAPV